MTLKRGQHGHDVTILQEALNLALALDPPLTADGVFGAATERAVVALQSSSVGPDGRPLHVDGRVGPLTRWALTTTIQTPPDSRELVRRGPARCALGGRAVDVLEREIRAGAREVGENNAGEFVAKYLAPLGIRSGSWCAGLTSYAVHTAADELGVRVPFQYSGTARGILRHLERAGLGYDPSEVDPMCGDVVVWWRGAPDGWQGHVGTVTDYEAGVMWTVEGNRGGYPAPVRQFSYVVERESRLLGFARLGKE